MGELADQIGDLVQEVRPQAAGVRVDGEQVRVAVFADGDGGDRIELHGAARALAPGVGAGLATMRSGFGRAGPKRHLEPVHGDHHRVARLLRLPDDGLALRDTVHAVEQVVHDLGDVVAHVASRAPPSAPFRRRIFTFRIKYQAASTISNPGQTRIEPEPAKAARSLLSQWGI